MLLVGEHGEDGWIYSTFNLTYRVAWEQLLLAVYGAYRFFSDPEVLVDGKPVEIGDPAEILTIAEDRNIMLRGISTVIAAPLMITFFNQVHFVNVSVGAVNDEFRDTDYDIRRGGRHRRRPDRGRAGNPRRGTDAHRG